MPKTTKCFVCRKKLSLVDQSIVCKCARRFCPRHRAYTEHACVARDPETPVPAATFAKVVQI
jgi:hypothetical protein